ncbi:uncharacterized protein BXZ73DRAFT_97334 [Epithele typhae]|uniref:uncharacterized protein n=1 Tax=Epithele typhae TaxID=378194 RepID=UPI002007A025|nr:uncharacterized protein BXZ73DRAFT_97334 [Epithele typhae]KAH9943284.1 hypothetical protein BXZ73DRAFT_97334 [Epithele typhae]
MNSRDPPPSYRSTYSVSHSVSDRSSLLGSKYNGEEFSTVTLWRWARTAGIALLVFAVTAFILQNAGFVSTLADDVPLSEKLALRAAWRSEEAAHAADRTKWAIERARWGDERTRWDAERLEWAHEQEGIARERQAWAQEQARWAQWRKEVAARRGGAHFTPPWHAGGGTCAAYGTRAYSAYMRDIPADADWYEVCMNTAYNFHGRWVEPDQCERGGRGEVWATWFIGFGEPECVTYWGAFREVASAPGKKRYEARLMNLRHGDTWDDMCRTSPADFRGRHFEHPTACEDRDGRTGVFEFNE